MITPLSDFIDNYVDGFTDGESEVSLTGYSHRYNGYVDGWYAGGEWARGDEPSPDLDYVRELARTEWENQH